MKRNFVVGLFGGLIGSAMLLMLLSATGVVGARGQERSSLLAPDPSVLASTPLTSTFTYQGQLKQGNAAVNGLCQMAFRLYDDPTADTNLIGNPFTTTVPVTNGLFAVGLNFGGSAFNSEGRWLDIRVNCGGGFVTLTPRQALTPAPYAFALPGLYTQPNPTSPNVIGGYSGNAISDTVVGGVIGGGGFAAYSHRVTDNYGTIGGGDNNQAGDAAGSVGDHTHATVGGGSSNRATGDHSTIGGGDSNMASGQYAAVGGGTGNTASGFGAFVGGGGYDGMDFSGNYAAGDASTVGGGEGNSASDPYSTVGGGGYNTASNRYSTVSGGYNNFATGLVATVPGGYANSATMPYSFAAGRYAQANHTGAFVWADSTNSAFASTAINQFLVRANGGVGINTTIPATNTLTVGGNGLRVGDDGTTLKRIQAGQANVGTGVSGVNVYTITFPAAFTNIPTIFVTPYNDPNFDAGNDNDTFAVTIRRRSTTQFVVNVFRIDNPGGGWAQSLRLNWYAGE